MEETSDEVECPLTASTVALTDQSSGDPFLMLGQLQLRLSQDLAGDPKRKGWSPAKVGCMSIYKNWS